MNDKQFKEFMKSMGKLIEELQSIKSALVGIDRSIGTASANMIENSHYE